MLTGSPKRELTALFRKELEDLSKRIGMTQMGSSFNSCRVMEEGPVLIMVWNSNENKYLEESSLQSVAAAIQNMLLKAYGEGLGSLWVCDVYYAAEAIAKHFHKNWGLAATVAIGWPAETPEPKPRRTVDEVTEFVGQ